MNIFFWKKHKVSEDKQTNPNVNRKKQTKRAVIGISVIAIGVWVLVSFLVSSKETAKRATDNETQSEAKEMNVSNSQQNPNNNTWKAVTDNKFTKQEKQIEALKASIEILTQNKAGSELQDDRYKQLIADVEGLKKYTSNLAALGAQKAAASEVTKETKAIKEDFIALTNTKSSSRYSAIENIGIFPELNSKKKNPDNYVPSGTFVKAVMLGGADASAGALGKANPNPVLLRILENGTLPNKKHSHLKDCLVTAAVVGDVSSERGLMRLERMSCTWPDGEIIDVEVEGTVFGTEGKNGVRGTPLWREGTLLLRAAAAGTLSGFSQGLSQSFTTDSISPLGSTQTVNNGDIFKYGAAQGISNAMDKLADYNIERAEQYHPVIQLSAGTIVDVVFLKGFYLDEKNHVEGKDGVAPDNDGHDSFNPDSEGLAKQENKDRPNSLALTETQAARIKAHEEAMGIK
jgi:conjugal transfer pilus assembly protein TraB